MKRTSVKEKIMRHVKLIFFLIVFSAALCNHYFFISVMPELQQETVVRRDIVMPPSLSLITVALGPIRGLIVDALWWRVSELQEAAEYFEIIRITDWITVLQPNNSFVWTYHAWNLAYNIAYEFPTAETRWKWICSGIKLLRDEGLKLNPGDAFIESELAWIFLDRIGGLSDPSRRYFIKQWAKTMGKFLLCGDREELEKIVESPDEYYAKVAAGLENSLNLDPEKMLRIDRDYGPFQWKLPQAQAVYWGVRKDRAAYSQGYLNYRMIVISAMQQAFLTGGLVEDKKNDFFVTTNNLEITENIIRCYKQQIKESSNSNYDKNFFNSFIIHAAPILYAFDRKDLAMKLYEEFRVINPDRKVEFNTFIRSNLLRMTESARGRYQQSLVEISLFNGYICLANGDFKQAAGFAESAENRWQKHQAKFVVNRTMLLPPLENLRVAAFVKVLKKFPKPERSKLIALVQNKMAGKLRIDNKLKFNIQ